MARGPRPRPRHPDRRDPVAAAPQARRLRDRPVLPAGRPHEARVHAQRARRLARRSPPGARASRSTRRRCCSRRRGSRAARSSTSRTSRRRSASSSSTLVFSKLVTWMRGQEGTPDLRALAYMDEVFGYVPPSAAPPAKKPILTIFKQGRAFGLGLVLSTQNPVDLDYKAMSNAGTWLVGRLQTENDKARVLEGLRSAAGGTDVAELDRAIGGLGKRQFLLVSAKASDARGSSTTRWAMSYLCGPLTKEQVARLTPATRRRRTGGSRRPQRRTDPRRRRPAPDAAARGDETSVAPPVARESRCRTSTRPRRGRPRSARSPASTRLRAFLAARVALRYDDSAAGVDEQQEFEAVYGPLDGGLDLDERDAGRLRRPRLRRRRARRAPPTCCPRRRSARRSSSPRRRRRSSATSSTAAPLELQRNRALKLVVAARRVAGGVRRALRRGRPGARRRRGGEDPRPARGEARPAGEGARAGAAPRRGARHGHALAPGDAS